MYLGLDIGTSVIKAALFGTNGKELVEAAERMQLLAGPVGWSELDGEAVWQTAVRVIGKLFTESAYRADKVRSVGVTGVMVGAWLLDADGNILRPPILWNDARAQHLVDEMADRQPGLFSKVFAHSGSMMQLGCTLPAIAWLKENEPRTLAKTTHVLCAKDYIRYRLTSVIATDESEAAMAPGSAVSRSFHDEQAQILGVTDFVGLLAPVRRGETKAGEITADAALLTGLPAGTPVAIGTGDTGACVLGAGAYNVGQAVTVLGTTCLNGVLFDTPVFEPKDLGLLFIIPGQRWMKTMVNVAGTTVLDWCLNAICPDLLAMDAPYEALGALAETGAAGSRGAVFVPYLSASGVIAPRIEPLARASFSGLAPHHGRADMVRAIYEGIAFAIRDCYEAIGGAGEGIRLSGGGARSPFWAQMIADVTGYTVEIPEGTQFGAKGAALCAAVAIGDFTTIQEAVTATYTAKSRHTPNHAVKPAYDDGFARFKVASGAALDVLRGVAI